MTENGVIDSCPPPYTPLPLPGDDKKVICEFMETASRDPPGNDRTAGADSRDGIRQWGDHLGKELLPLPLSFPRSSLASVAWPGVVR